MICKGEIKFIEIPNFFSHDKRTLFQKKSLKTKDTRAKVQARSCELFGTDKTECIFEISLFYSNSKKRVLLDRSHPTVFCLALFSGHSTDASAAARDGDDGLTNKAFCLSIVILLHLSPRSLRSHPVQRSFDCRRRFTPRHRWFIWPKPSIDAKHRKVDEAILHL